MMRLSLHDEVRPHYMFLSMRYNPHDLINLHAGFTLLPIFFCGIFHNEFPDH